MAAEELTCFGCKAELGFIFHEQVLRRTDPALEVVGAGLCEVCGRDWTGTTEAQVRITFVPLAES